jgi:hypothetical protein
MDKKTSTCITGFVICAVLYANISSPRADMRAHAVDTFALAYVSARPAVFMPQWHSTPRNGQGTVAREPSQAQPSAQRHFAEYLQLHRSRIDSAQLRRASRAALP